MGYPSHDLTLEQYQRRALETAIYPGRVPSPLDYTILGLVGEAGEVADKRKKQLRDGVAGPGDAALVAELGDVLWYVAAIARELGVSLEDVAEGNLRKLEARAHRGTLGGAGDER